MNISRPLFLSILHAALINNEWRFARQSALQWLAAYPGDLQVSQVYAQALLGEKRIAEARTVLKGLCQSDPEDRETVQHWLKLEVDDFNQKKLGQRLSEENFGSGKSGASSPSQEELISVLSNWLIALNDNPPPPGPPIIQPTSFSPHSPQVAQPTGWIQPWGERLQIVRKSLDSGDFTTAEQNLPDLMIQQNTFYETNSPLLAVIHLKALRADPTTPLPACRNMAEFYHRRWPDCLACTLLLANWLLQEGATERAVALLHKAAARDVSGQVAHRIFGPNHPYRSLWPNELSLSMDLVIPANVARVLGWNRLPAGHPLQTQSDTLPVPGESQTGELSYSEAKLDDLKWAYAATAINRLETNASPHETFPQSPTAHEDIIKFSAELDRMAIDLNQLPASQYDGRFPVYVIFSVHCNLEAQYGAQGAADVEAEMKRLAQTIGDRKAGSPRERWNSTVFLPDRLVGYNPESPTKLSPTGESGFPAVLNRNGSRQIDPWSLKLSLADLDKSLGKKGEMIGALLIVGGPEIVPFHHLPNPVDDPDSEVPSDNPYATRDENYFIPEWPVGRIPGGVGNDPSLLLHSLRQIQARQASQSKGFPRPRRWLTWFTRWVKPNSKPIRKGFGITAAVWRQASFQVFRPVAEAKAVMISPPISMNGASGNGHKPAVLPPARLGYFNLHGLADAAEWYGQRDPQGAGDVPDYPVALRPADVRSLAEKNLGSVLPLVVFSEACYGAHILSKTIEQALALQFLEAGTQIVAGSTTMSYGAINAPLIGADLLGYKFWKALLEGLSAGEALQRAKIELASEMHQRQGYLDGEDQKTLISFVLYGDPLMRLSEDVRISKHRRKPFRRLSIRPPQVKTVCDRVLETDQGEALPPEVITSVKQFVANYLPGMSDAHATYSAERAVCIASVGNNRGHTCPTAQLNKGESCKNQPDRSPDHHMVVLSKTLENAGHTHPQFARLTLDSHGKLVKIVVSR